jgi:amino acid adenylation domain-containing protein
MERAVGAKEAKPGTDAKETRDVCLHELFEAHARRAPEKTAVTCEGEGLTYGELNARANGLARRLRELGVGPETPVALCVERSVEMVVAVLGIMKAGGAYVPVDPTYPQERLEFMLKDAVADVVVTQRSLAGRLSSNGISLVFVEEIGATDGLETPASGVTPDNLAYVIYTSGSTGQPKGVMVTHRSAHRLFKSTEPWFHFDGEDVWTLFHSITFDFSVWEIWGALAYGGRLVVVPYWKSRSPAEFLAILARERVTVLNQTPSAFRQLAAADEKRQEPLALRFVILGGEALAPGSLKNWFDRHGDVRPHLINMYGITETTVLATYRRMRVGDCDGPSVIGEAIPEWDLLLLDAALKKVGAGETGEIHIGGPGLARGYWRRPELTQERFIANPFSADAGARLYKSGDLARFLPSGDLEFLGRADQQVKIRGFRIELGEIEAVLSVHPSVREAVVVTKSDQTGENYLAAYVVAQTGAPAKSLELRDFLKQRLPDYMVPVGFMFLEHLPLTLSGKIDRRNLPEWVPATDKVKAASVGPSTLVEGQLIKIWSRLIGTHAFGIRESFFDLGGHSLMAVRLLLDVQKKFGQKLSLATLYAAPTVELLARVLTEGEGAIPASDAGQMRGAKSGTPLFYIPGIYGVGVLPEPLAREIGKVRPYHDRLQYAGVDGQEPPFKRVEDIASHLIRQIRQICPFGPYGLCGYSFGGVVAYEVARQLRAQDFEIETLILWDSWTPQGITSVRRPLRKAVAELGRRLRAVNLAEQPKVLWELIQDKVSFVGTRYSKRLAAQWITDTTQIVSEASLRAYEDFQPEPYAGSAILFRSDPVISDHILSERHIRELNGWGGLITGKLEDIEFPCDHDALWKSPMLEALAEKTVVFLQQKPG